MEPQKEQRKIAAKTLPIKDVKLNQFQPCRAISFKIEELSLKEEYERLKKSEKKIIDLKSSLAIQSENLKQKALQFQQQKKEFADIDEFVKIHYKDFEQFLKEKTKNIKESKDGEDKKE